MVAEQCVSCSIVLAPILWNLSCDNSYCDFSKAVPLEGHGLFCGRNDEGDYIRLTLSMP